MAEALTPDVIKLLVSCQLRVNGQHLLCLGPALTAAIWIAIAIHNQPLVFSASLAWFARCAHVMRLVWQ